MGRMTGLSEDRQDREGSSGTAENKNLPGFKPTLAARVHTPEHFPQLLSLNNSNNMLKSVNNQGIDKVVTSTERSDSFCLGSTLSIGIKAIERGISSVAYIFRF